MASTSPSQPIIIFQRTSIFSKIFAVLGWIGFLSCLAVMFVLVVITGSLDLDNMLQHKHVSGKKGAEQRIAVITVGGIIGGSEDEGFVKKQIDAVRKDDKVKAIVVRVDSPGGAVVGADYLYHHLKLLKEEKQCPLVVSMGGMAASGGYYVSMAVGGQENSIFAEPTTTTGSIGVIIPHYDVSGLLAKYDVKDDSIMSHERKQMLAMTRPISPENRALIQSYVDETLVRFKTVVKEGRPNFAKDPAALDKLATGEIFTADKALENKLIDKIGFVEAAIERVAELASLQTDSYEVIKFKKPASLWEGFELGRARASFSPLDISALQELSVPRAYYLTTTLPAVASGRGE